MHICTVIVTEFLGAHVLMVSPANLDLKVSRLSALVASSGMLFQIRVASGKNECLAVGRIRYSKTCDEGTLKCLNWDV